MLDTWQDYQHVPFLFNQDELGKWFVNFTIILYHPLKFKEMGEWVVSWWPLCWHLLKQCYFAINTWPTRMAWSSAFFLTWELNRTCLCKAQICVKNEFISSWVIGLTKWTKSRLASLFWERLGWRDEIGFRALVESRNSTPDVAMRLMTCATQP